MIYIDLDADLNMRNRRPDSATNPATSSLLMSTPRGPYQAEPPYGESELLLHLVAVAAMRDSASLRRRTGGMVAGMADMRKITVTLPAETVAAVRRLVGLGEAASVSGFVQHAVGVALDDVAGWGAALNDALASTGGELSAQERAWADDVLERGAGAGAA